MAVDSRHIGPIGIQMKREQLTKTFMIISNWSPWFIQKYFSVVRVKYMASWSNAHLSSLEIKKMKMVVSVLSQCVSNHNYSQISLVDIGLV